MHVHATTAHAAETDADTIAVGVIEGERIPHDVEGGALQALVDAGEAKARPGHLAVAHAAGRRWILAGLGSREALDDEALRRAAAAVAGRARDLGTSALCWELPHRAGGDPARALVEGTLLAAYRFERFRSGTGDEGPALGSLVLSDHEDRSQAAARAAVVAQAVNAARDLQNTPANHMTPGALAARARELAEQHAGIEVEVHGRDGIEELRMGAFAAVARGTDEEPALIVARYEPAGARGPRLGLVGKAVTFDSGGISIKPSAKMHEMKFDMSGGAAVLEALGAIARLDLEVRVLAVVGATENLLGPRAMKPGDIVTARNGTTIEVNNTDAEGRLVLADCLAYAVELGAERLVDVATLTGGVVVALGSTYTALFAGDDDWAAEVAAAAQDAGEPVWRMPMHDEYAEMIKGRFGDIVNTTDARKAVSCTAAHFLSRFTADVPWAHLDIAGTAWDVGRPYAAKGGSGVGVRTLVALAERAAGGQ